MSNHNKKIAFYLSIEVLMLTMIISLILSTCSATENFRRIIGFLSSIPFIVFLILYRVDYDVRVPEKVCKFRKTIYNLSLALLGVAILSRFASVPYSQVWTFLALPPTLLHFVLEIVLYLKGDLKIE